MAIVLITIPKKYRPVGTKLNAVVKVLKYAESVARRCSYKFRKIHRKTILPQSVFQKNCRPRPATLLKKKL